MKIRSLVAVLVAGLSAGCTSVEIADVLERGRRHGLALTCEQPPSGAVPLRMLSVNQSGWYLLGYLPVMSVSMDECLELACHSARECGADGIACVGFSHVPAAFFRFSIFPVPDWSASVVVTGMAYRNAPGSGNATGPSKPAR